MTSPEGNRNDAIAWFSVLDGAAPTFNERLVELWRLSPPERAELAGATGAAAAVALIAIMARRAADPESLGRLVPPGRLLHDGVVQQEILLSDGRSVEVFGAPVRGSGGVVVGRMVFYRDVTERRRDDAELRDQARRQSALARLARIAVATEGIEPLLESAAAIVAETLQVELCAVMELAGADQLVLRSGVGWPAGALGSAVASGSRVELALSLMAAGPLVAVDTGGGVAVAGEPLPFQASSGAAVLIQGRDRPSGLLAAYGLGVRPFGREELAFLETAAGILGATLARHHAECERGQLAARLALADRMASVGTMAAGVAHELNNPLAYISANLSYVADGLQSILAAVPAAAVLQEGDGSSLGAELAKAIDEARQGADRMRVIIRDLLAMSRSDGATRGPVDVARILESCINVAANEIRHRATLEKELADVPPVLANPARLSQVFLNLLVNAAHAIPRGDPAKHRIRVATSRAEDGRVAVELSDTGDGICPEHLPRIFDPFFTTKPIGVGTGLGLAICHSIVTSYGGEIRVESAVGRGTTFRVLLAPVAATEPASGSVPGGADA